MREDGVLGVLIDIVSHFYSIPSIALGEMVHSATINKNLIAVSVVINNDICVIPEKYARQIDSLFLFPVVAFRCSIEDNLLLNTAE